MRPRVFFAAAVIGVLTGVDDFLYACGVSRLPVSTTFLITVSQLGFTAFFAFLLVKQKFTPYSITALYGLVLPMVEMTYNKAKQAITVKTSAVCGPHLQSSAEEEVAQTSAVCSKKTGGEMHFQLKLDMEHDYFHNSIGFNSLAFSTKLINLTGNNCGFDGTNGDVEYKSRIIGEKRGKSNGDEQQADLDDDGMERRKKSPARRKGREPEADDSKPGRRRWQLNMTWKNQESLVQDSYFSRGYRVLAAFILRKNAINEVANCRFRRTPVK
ncbi:hypothetical protein LXL04_011083 [Taraxacum kok-saghyz]